MPSTTLEQRLDALRPQPPHARLHSRIAARLRRRKAALVLAAATIVTAVVAVAVVGVKQGDDGPGTRTQDIRAGDRLVLAGVAKSAGRSTAASAAAIPLYWRAALSDVIVRGTFVAGADGGEDSLTVLEIMKGALQRTRSATNVRLPVELPGARAGARYVVFLVRDREGRHHVFGTSQGRMEVGGGARLGVVELAGTGVDPRSVGLYRRPNWEPLSSDRYLELLETAIAKTKTVDAVAARYKYGSTSGLYWAYLAHQRDNGNALRVLRRVLDTDVDAVSPEELNDHAGAARALAWMATDASLRVLEQYFRRLVAVRNRDRVRYVQSAALRTLTFVPAEDLKAAREFCWSVVGAIPEESRKELHAAHQKIARRLKIDERLPLKDDTPGSQPAPRRPKDSAAPPPASPDRR